MSNQNKQIEQKILLICIKLFASNETFDVWTTGLILYLSATTRGTPSFNNDDNDNDQ